MKYENAILKVLKYIEKNIKEELTIEIIAKEVGYSKYHFSRIFKEHMEISIMEYVKERRLICASKEIYKGKKIIDISTEYGYKTHSGFSKAFNKKFGFTPTQNLIYAIGILACLNNEEGDSYNMKNNFENASPFIRPSIDFKEPEILYKELIENISKRYSDEDLKLVEKAYNLAYKSHENHYRKSGEQYITHPLCVSIILSEMELDKNIIIAGLLHDIIEEDTPSTLKQVEIEFSKEISKLIDEVTRFNIIIKEEISIDANVVLIKLADRLHNMRTIKYMDP